MNSARVRMPLVLGLALVAHLTVLGDVHVDGVRPDALLLVAVAGGLVAGPERGAIVGFCAGLLADLYLQTPFGLSALVYCLVGFGVGSFQSAILRSTWWIPVLVSLTGSAVGVVLYALVGAMVGETAMVAPRLIVIASLVGVMNACLAPIAVRLVTWSFRSALVARPFSS